MKKLFCILMLLLSVCFLASCVIKESEDPKPRPVKENIKESVKTDDGINIVIEANINKRIEIFLQKNFSTNRIVFFDSFDNMSEELNRLVFETAIYKGLIHEYSWKMDDGLSQEMIEDNIKAVFGPKIISGLDYSCICADYDEEQAIYIPWQITAPLYAYPYVFHSMEIVKDNMYKAIVSQISTDNEISAFDAEGKKTTPPQITEIQADKDFYEAREEAIEALKQEILQNPEMFERAEVVLEVGEGYIYVVSARKIM
jgi:hypothetical protein